MRCNIAIQSKNQIFLWILWKKPLSIESAQERFSIAQAILFCKKNWVNFVGQLSCLKNSHLSTFFFIHFQHSILVFWISEFGGRYIKIYTKEKNIEKNENVAKCWPDKISIWLMLFFKNNWLEISWAESIINTKLSGWAGISLLSIITMASSIKLFQFVQKFHRALGIYPSYSSSSCSRLKLVLICLIQVGLTLFTFLLFEAKSMYDYGFGCCILISQIIAIVTYLSFVWQSKNTANSIANWEKFIAKSK